MVHALMSTIDCQLLYIHRAQTHGFVADGTRMSFFSNRI
ncbi:MULTISPECIES: RAxF-45 family protein [Pontibacillus]